MKQIYFYYLLLLLFVSCFNSVETKELMINSGDHDLAVKTLGEGNITILFESGLGEKYYSWEAVVDSLKWQVKLILYNRADISPSENTENSASIENMIADLDAVLSTLADGEKLILVGHSLGGAIIRSYALKFPEKVSGLVFIDPSHEYGLDEMSENEIEEEERDYLSGVNIRTNRAVAKEKREFYNTLKYLSTLDNLPDIPVISLTSLGYHEDQDLKEYGRNVSESLSMGVTDFTHIEVSDSGHFIQIDKPTIVSSAVMAVVNKIR